MSLLGFILPDDEKVSPGIRNFRLSLCNNCQFIKKGFCGTPIIGEFIKYNDQPVLLCGCKMTEKTELKSAECPLKKW